jgi:hypothetical protein
MSSWGWRVRHGRRVLDGEQLGRGAARAAHAHGYGGSGTSQGAGSPWEAHACSYGGGGTPSRYGSWDAGHQACDENSAYVPRSPRSAAAACAHHRARASARGLSPARPHAGRGVPSSLIGIGVQLQLRQHHQVPQSCAVPQLRAQPAWVVGLRPLQSGKHPNDQLRRNNLMQGCLGARSGMFEGRPADVSSGSAGSERGLRARAPSAGSERGTRVVPASRHALAAAVARAGAPLATLLARPEGCPAAKATAPVVALVVVTALAKAAARETRAPRVGAELAFAMASHALALDGAGRRPF